MLTYRVDTTAPTGGSSAGRPIIVIPAATGTDSTTIKRIGPLYNATFNFAAGKPTTYTDSRSGVTIALRSATHGSYRLIVAR